MKKQMKNLLFILLTTMLFVSCDKGVNPNDAVGLSAAFKHCAGTTSYWIWGVILTAAASFGLFKQFQAYQKEGTFSGVLLFAFVVIIFLAWCMRPADLAWNTTVEQAARGVWIGY